MLDHARPTRPPCSDLRAPRAARHLTAHPVVIERAQGAEVWDVDGRRYLDFVGGIGVLNVGHNHPRVVAARCASSSSGSPTPRSRSRPIRPISSWPSG